MWKGQINHLIRPSTYSKRRLFFIDKEFQLKYTRVIVLATASSVLLASIPVYYLLNKNYDLFIQISYLNLPEIVKHLEREKTILLSVTIASFFGLLTFFTVIGFKMTNQLIGPIKVLNNHMRFLISGKWDQKEITLRSKDEFKNIINTYNYFYLSYQNQIKNDLKRLQKIKVDSKDRQSIHELEELINEKKNQLGLANLKIEKNNTNSLSAENDPLSPESLHAS